MPLLENLPQVEDTVWGRELKEIWREEGRDEGRKEGREEGQVKGEIKALQEDLRKYERLLAEGKMSQELFDSLAQDVQTRLNSLTSPS